MAGQELSNDHAIFKVCMDCKFELPLSEFYKHSQMADGHLNKCKDCVRGRVKQHYLDNKEEMQIRDRRRYHDSEERKAYIKSHRKEYHQRNPEAATVYSRADRARNPDKYKARTALGNALRDGKIARKTCEVCGSPAQAHHEDYAKPLDVRWMCPKHHMVEHHKER